MHSVILVRTGRHIADQIVCTLLEPLQAPKSWQDLIFGLEVGLKASLKVWSSTHRSLSGAISFKWFSHLHRMSNSVSLVSGATPDSTLSCLLCQAHMQDSRVIPGCLHSYCRSCLEKHAAGQLTFTCPAASCQQVLAICHLCGRGRLAVNRYQRSTYSYKLLTGSTVAVVSHYALGTILALSRPRQRVPATINEYFTNRQYIPCYLSRGKSCRM